MQRLFFYFIFFRGIFWAFCEFISWIGQLKSRQETGAREREGMTCSKGSQVESNPWPLWWGHSLCIWGVCCSFCCLFVSPSPALVNIDWGHQPNAGVKYCFTVRSRSRFHSSFSLSVSLSYSLNLHVQKTCFQAKLSCSYVTLFLMLS